MSRQQRILDSIEILNLLGMPRAQQNDRSALCLLALLNLTPEKAWLRAESPLMGITPIMDWCREHYDKDYAPNTRETIRRQTIHQFIDAGIALHNPDDQARSVNSPYNVYQIESNMLELLKAYGSKQWKIKLRGYLSERQTLVEKYAKRREQELIPVVVTPNKELKLSPGEHSVLIKSVIENFAPRFVPGAKLAYVGDTGDKWGLFDEALFQKLGISLDFHGKMPDVVLYHKIENWLLLVEVVTSHGPVDAKRHTELSELFSSSSVGLIFVTAFPTKAEFSRYVSNISWETEVWISENPSHLIHFDGERFLGPYAEN